MIRRILEAVLLLSMGAFAVGFMLIPALIAATILKYLLQ